MDRTANSRILPLHRDQSFSNRGRMQPEITQAVSNITISKTYIDHENPDSRVVTASEKCIVSPVRDRTTSFYAPVPSTAFRKGSLVSRQAVGRQNQAGAVQGICQKEGFEENEQINLYGWQRPRGFWWNIVEQYWSRLENANAPKTPSIKRLVRLCKVKITKIVSLLINNHKKWNKCDGIETHLCIMQNTLFGLIVR